VLLLLGVLGLLLGDGLLLGLVNIDIVEDIIHLITGGLFAYVGFGQRDEGVARTVVLVVSVIYALVGLLGFVCPTCWGCFSTATPWGTTSYTWPWASWASWPYSPWGEAAPGQAERDKADIVDRS